MEAAIVAACITVVGMTVTAIATAFINHRSQRELVSTHLTKALREIHEENAARLAAERLDKLAELVGEILEHTDPFIVEKVDTKRVIPLIHRAQIRVCTADRDEGELNKCLTKLAFAVCGVNADGVTRYQDDRLIVVGRCHSNLLDAAQKVFGIQMPRRNISV
jgi:hypothetical protein